ncbi:MAG: hypothetical protein K9G39_08930 [Chlorobium sp.]|uniref:hypothetical protein n=1 Tax=Chlorobium sp. TaxID=1095 RepID=UPI0025B88F7E|nr:hypothetical protein [Chlorobium sp.]MCF8383696.1 hypothetical protein [Chlorobium sp.]
MFLTGSPFQQREKRFDERRVENLREIALSIDYFFSRYGSIPESLEQLEKSGNIAIDITDPETDKIYDYEKISKATYRLCAVFSQHSEKNVDKFLSHGAGKVCFVLNAKKIETR